MPESPLDAAQQAQLGAIETANPGLRDDLDLLGQTCDRALRAERTVERLDAIEMRRVAVRERVAGTLDLASLAAMGEEAAE